MELEILEENKEKLKFQLNGEGHTFSNPLSKELWNDTHIKTSGYTIKHSLINSPVFLIETDGNENPKSAVKKAISRLEKEMNDFLVKFKQLK